LIHQRAARARVTPVSVCPRCSERASHGLGVAGNFQPNSFTAITASVRLDPNFERTDTHLGCLPAIWRPRAAARSPVRQKAASTKLNNSPRNMFRHANSLPSRGRSNGSQMNGELHRVFGRYNEQGASVGGDVFAVSVALVSGRSGTASGQVPRAPIGPGR
jgi:hypothetical protein